MYSAIIGLVCVLKLMNILISWYLGELLVDLIAIETNGAIKVVFSSHNEFVFCYHKLYFCCSSILRPNK